MSNMSEYQTFIHASKYARWRDEDGRRETWDETVLRYTNFWLNRSQIEIDEASELREAIYNLEVMPSMRALMTAGEALERDNVAGFNCSYMAIDSPRRFDELMYILMCGTGVGFSVERQYIAKLPKVAEDFHGTETCIVVADSKIGWAKAFRELIALLYSGQVPQWDVSRVRSAGARLKTFGGRASGPQPLVELFNHTVSIFKGASGRKLTSIECHDLCCKIAQVIVVGGVRRSALISLSNLSDDRLRSAKSGDWRMHNPHRELANNSVCYTEKPEFPAFLKEMTALYESFAGERGLISRPAMQAVAERSGRRDPDHEFGTNPCSEIILRPNQFCNLSEVVVRADDTLEMLKEKVRKATILGTLQATLTDFRYLSPSWKRNTEEEALLGVSLTGIMDHPVLSGELETAQWLTEMKEVAIATNKEWAGRLGINPSTAITCVKPSGTVSQLVNSSSGIHPRFSPYYVRTVRADNKDPLAKYMVEAGFPVEDALGFDGKPAGNGQLVFSFPVESPEGAVCVPEVGAIEQLELVKLYNEHWCEHKASCTIYYRDSEFLAVAQWIWDNFNTVSGISLLPRDDHIYMQAPYQPCSKSEYQTMLKGFPKLDMEEFSKFEVEDNTTSSQELACTGLSCEL